MERDRQRAANSTDLCPCLCSQHPSHPSKPPIYKQQSWSTIRPQTPDHTRSLSVFLAYRVHKSLAQVHTASCGTFRAITSCSKAPCFCLTYKKAWSSYIYLSFFSKLVQKRCQERHSINGRNFFFWNFELFTQIKATHQNFQDSDLTNREKKRILKYSWGLKTQYYYNRKTMH